MTRGLKGTSQFAVMAEALPVQARICLAIFAADVAFQYLQPSPDIHLARKALTYAISWHQGKRVDLRKWELELEGTVEDGMSFAILRAKKRSKKEFHAWLVFRNAIDYVAYRAFLAENRPTNSSLENIGDRILDDVDKDLRAFDPSSMSLMTRAAKYLEEHPDAGLSELNAHVSKE